jgi:hypothetical protein
MNILKKENLTRNELLSNLFTITILVFTYGLTMLMEFPGDKEESLGSLHFIFNLLVSIGISVYTILTISKSLNHTMSWCFSEDTSDKEFNFKSKLLFTLVYMILATFIFNSVDKSKELYNYSVSSHLKYDKSIQRKEVSYDFLWKTASVKSDIKIENVETFIKITKVILDGRKDGDKVTWKWLQENQPIPYSEYTKFYSDLSYFIESKRYDIMMLENESQDIAEEYNRTINQFPNSFYANILGLENIDYKASISSSKTKEVFRTGVESEFENRGK